MARVLNERDFYYGAFLFALLNKKIHPAAIVESDDEYCQVCNMCTDQHEDFKLVMKYSAKDDTSEQENCWGRTFNLQEHDLQELMSSLKAKKDVKLALICVKSKFNDSEIAILNSNAIKKLLAIKQKSFRISFKKNSSKIDIIKNRKPFFQVTRNWQKALFEDVEENEHDMAGGIMGIKFNIMDEFEVKNKKPLKLLIENGRYNIASWKEMFITLCNWFIECDWELFKKLMNNPSFHGHKRCVIQRREAGLRKPMSVGHGFFVETNYSATEFLHYSGKLIEAYQDLYELKDKVFIFVKG